MLKKMQFFWSLFPYFSFIPDSACLVSLILSLKIGIHGRQKHRFQFYFVTKSRQKSEVKSVKNRAFLTLIVVMQDYSYQDMTVLYDWSWTIVPKWVVRKNVRTIHQTSPSPLFRTSRGYGEPVLLSSHVRDEFWKRICLPNK